MWGLANFGCLGFRKRMDAPATEAPLEDTKASLDQNSEQCWICLEPGMLEPLVRPCGCPSYVHERCMARWQLQSAGKEEERSCRFCKRVLPDWRQSLTPPDLKPSRTAVMAVVLNGREHRITVEPGPDGRKQFEKEIRRLFSLADEDELEFTFDCQAPGSGLRPGAKAYGDNLQLEGKGAFEAAFHCAAVTAALRAQRKGRPA